MSLFGAVDIPGKPDLENVRKLDLLPLKMIRRAHRVGIAIDPPYFHELTSKFTVEIESLAKDIANYIPTDRLNEFSDKSAPGEGDADDTDERADDFNAGSPEQIGKLLYDVLGIGSTKTLKRTKGGALSTGKRQLELVKLEHPVVPLILRHRELRTLVKNYTMKLPHMARWHPRGNCCPICELPHDSDQWRVHGEMGTTRAETGRINHKNPNLGNVPARSPDGQAVQAGFVAPPGKRLVNRDLSQIELRCLAHLSNCSSMIAVYDAHGDLHTDTCRRTGLTPADREPTLGERMGAKRCIAKGQRVLTKRGLVAIQNVLCDDLVWDGLEWVRHNGVVYNGLREVIEYDGLTATPDHKVYAESGETATLQEMQRRGTRLAVTGVEETPVRYTHDYQYADSPERNWVLSCLHALFTLRQGWRDARQQRRARRGQRVQVREQSEIQRRSGGTPFSQEIPRDQTTLREPRQSELGQLWWARNQELLQDRRGFCEICVERTSAHDLLRTRHWAHKQQRALRAWQSGSGDACTECTQQTEQPLGEIQRRMDCSARFTYTSHRRLSDVSSLSSTHLRLSRTDSMAGDSYQKDAQTLGKEAEVYDIVNAGPRHRYTVENKLVGNCNFSVQNGTTEKGLYLQLITDFGANKTPLPDWLTEAWCGAFIESWLNSRPEVREYFELSWYRARRYGLVWDIFGRVRLIPEVRSTHRWIREAGLRQAQNMAITATAAGQLKLAMGKADELLLQLYEQGVWCWPLLTIHDAIKVECDEDVADDVNDLLGVAMDTCMDDVDTGEHMFRVPITSDGSVHSRWEK